MSEQRTFSRTATRIKAYGRFAESLDTAPLFKSAPPTSKLDISRGLMHSQLPKGMLDFLIGLDNKLDRLLSMMSRDQIKEDFDLRLEVLDLSGAGMVFRTPTKIEDDAILEVVLVLSQFPLLMAGSKGQVVGRDDLGLIRFQFHDIRESDREAIVQFVFKEEREHLRSRRNGL